MKRLYIVHGWTFTTDYWQPLLDELKSRGYEPVMLNVPGLTKPSKRAWDIDDYVNWLHEQLKGVSKPVLLAHSNGGRIALNFASRQPNKLGQLILIDSAGVWHNEPLLRLKRSLLRNVAQVGKKVVPVEAGRKLFYKAIRAKDYYQAPPNMRQTMQNMLESDKRLDIRAITTPTSLIWGSVDKATPLSDAKAMQTQIAGSKLEVIDGAAHAPYYTHPKQTADAIEAALRGQA